MKSRDNIWNHHEKYIKTSTNMPGIGSLIRKIHVKITEKCERKTYFRSVRPMPAFNVLTGPTPTIGMLSEFQLTN